MNDLATHQDTTLEIIKSAPDALMLNEDQVTKAVNGCTNILNRIATEGMSDELDALCNKAQVRLKEVYAEVKDRRTPLTKMFDDIRKRFTEQEGKIDPAAKDSVYAKLQASRNAYATAKMEKQRQIQAENERKLKADQERISLKSEAEIQLRNGFLSDLQHAKEMMVDTFESTTLDNYKLMADKIIQWDDVYHINEFQALSISIRPMYCTTAEVENIKMNARIGKFEDWVFEYKQAITTQKQELIDKMPGKKTELEAIANANAAEKKRLEKEAEARRIADKEKAEQELWDQKLKDLQAVESKKNTELTNTLFDNAVLQAENPDVKVAESYDIEITNPAGWMLIFQFWFQREGMKETADKIEKKSMKQMKTFCEGYFKKNNEKIESPYIIYKPVYKVRAEK